MSFNVFITMPNIIRYVQSNGNYDVCSAMSSIICYLLYNAKYYTESIEQCQASWYIAVSSILISLNFITSYHKTSTLQYQSSEDVFITMTITEDCLMKSIIRRPEYNGNHLFMIIKRPKYIFNFKTSSFQCQNSLDHCIIHYRTYSMPTS